jgi:cellulose synthase/poly-beta-1,6-N-acetylglucosamine synthase-like glycosyltransferase
MSDRMSTLPDSLPSVTVIIPHFNDSQRLRKCLFSLQKQTYPDNRFEIIVVNNGSEESCFALAADFKPIRIVNETHRGSYRARNTAISHAKGVVLAFTDADCIPSLKWLEEGVTCLLSNEGLGIVGGKIVYFFKSANNPNAYECYDSNRFLDQKRCIEKSHFSVTANMFTFKRIFVEAGLFNANMQSGGDVEWGNRVHAHGFGLVFCSAAVVFHPARNKFKQVYKKTIRVAQGTAQLEFRGLKTRAMIRRVIRKDLVPPLNKTIEIYRSKEHISFMMKVKLILLTVFFKYVAMWTKLHTYFSVSRN